MNGEQRTGMTGAGHADSDVWRGLSTARSDTVITLTELLESREQRAAYQQRLLAADPGSCLISFMINMPGEIKYCALTIRLHQLGMAAIEEQLAQAGADVWYQEVRPLLTGIEGYLCVAGDAAAVKELMCGVEERHPLGRLFDIDVLAGSGRAISRVQQGALPRKCLLCEEEAALCARSKAHGTEELIAKMREMLDRYELHG